MIGGNKPTASVLVFGGDHIDLTVATSGINNSIIVKSRNSQPYGGIVDGEFCEPDKLPEVLAMLFAAVRTSGKLFIGVPATFCRVNISRERKTFAKPQKITAKEITALLGPGRAIYFKIDGGNPILDATDYMVKETLEAQVSHVSIAPVFAAALRGTLKTRDVEFVPMPLASAMYVIPQPVRDKTAVLISCEMFTTSVAVVAGDQLCALETIEMGSAHIINEISLVKKVGYEAAKKMYEQNDGVAAIVDARLEDIAEQIAGIVHGWDKELVKQPFYMCGGHIDAIKSARATLERALDTKIIPTACPFTESNAPDLVAGDAVIQSALKTF